MANILVSSYKQLGSDYQWTSIKKNPGSDPANRVAPIRPKAFSSPHIVGSESAFTGCTQDASTHRGQACRKPKKPKNDVARRGELMLSALNEQRLAQKLSTLTHPPLRPNLSAFSFASAFQSAVSATVTSSECVEGEEASLSASSLDKTGNEVDLNVMLGSSSSAASEPRTLNNSSPEPVDESSLLIKQIKQELFDYEVLDVGEVHPAVLPIPELVESQLQPQQSPPHHQQQQQQQLQHCEEAESIISRCPETSLGQWLNRDVYGDNSPHHGNSSKKHGGNPRYRWRAAKSPTQKKVDHANRERARVRERRKLLTELSTLVPELKRISQSSIPGERKHGLSTVEVLRATCSYIRRMHTADRPASQKVVLDISRKQKMVDLSRGITKCTKQQALASPADSAQASPQAGTTGIVDDATADSSSLSSALLDESSSDMLGLLTAQPSPEEDIDSPLQVTMHHADMLDGDSNASAAEDWLNEFREWTRDISTAEMPTDLIDHGQCDFEPLFRDEVPCPGPAISVPFVGGQLTPDMPVVADQCSIIGDTQSRLGSASPTASDLLPACSKPPLGFSFDQTSWYGISQGDDVPQLMQLADLEETVHCECPEEFHPDLDL
ncbi:uncharacterized protein LOC135808913 [Sycon ciliatum]|uniref:uncharacterized protein LOC135808913 n=1 Tax=Sycon ciliatum TaxID=27933 RepID=UPI0031F6DF1D